MAAAGVTTFNSPLPSPEVNHHSSGSSFLLPFLLSVVCLVGLPILFYAFFMMIKCPHNPFRRSPRPNPGGPVEKSSPTISGDMVELVSGLKYKEGEAKEYGSECPVCLSVFTDGEDVWQLIACKHVFHSVCIDKWFHSQSSCPVCRGSVPIKRFKKLVARGGHRDDDFRQGLPDSAALV